MEEKSIRLPAALKNGFLNGNTLKMIALITMTIDHIGMIIFPQYRILRVIGRIAFPIFAFMIAEGCRYTRSRLKYISIIFAVGLLCQTVYFFYDHSLYMCIMITFTLSVALTYLYEIVTKKGSYFYLILAAALAAVYIISEKLPDLPALAAYGYGIDYGISGILLPVIISAGKRRDQRLILAAVGMLLVCLQHGGVQWWSMLSFILLLFYNGQRGRLKLKWLFYVYYPLHLVALQGIDMLIK